MKVTEQFLNNMLNSYLETAQWTNETLDNIDSIFDKQSLKQAKNDCKSFLNQINDNEIVPYDLGHDFWLTRNHHGAGFWDNEKLSETQQIEFTKIAQSFNEVNIFLNDNNKLSIE